LFGFSEKMCNFAPALRVVASAGASSPVGNAPEGVVLLAKARWRDWAVFAYSKWGGRCSEFLLKIRFVSY